MSMVQPNLDQQLERWDTCRRCHDQCVSGCPVFRVTGDTRHYPSRLAEVAIDLIDRPGSTWPVESLELYYGGCVLCGLCEENCAYGNDPHNVYDIVLTMRERLAPQHKIAELYRERREAMLPSAEASAAYEKLLARLGDVAVVAGSGAVSAEEHDVLLLIDPFSAQWFADGVVALVSLLQRAGAQVWVLDRSYELGGLLWQEGLSTEASRQAAEAADLLAALGVPKVVTTLPTDAWYWSRERQGAAVRVVSAVNAVEEMGAQRELSAGREAELPLVAIQDSSALSRLLKERQLVTSLLAGRAEVLPEPGVVGERRTSQPVAYEGVPVLLSQEVQEGMVANRLDQLRVMKPHKVLTMDPFTHRALSRVADRIGAEVETLFEFLV